MRHLRQIARANTVIAVCVLALGLTGVSLAGVVRHAITAKLTVTFTDTKLTISPGSLQAGTATFVAVNKGQKLHALAITGPGLKGARTPKLAAGKSAKLTVTLRAGVYMLSDPINLGMSKMHWVNVKASSTASSATSGGSSSATSGGSSGGGVITPPAMPGMSGGGGDDDMMMDH